MARRLEAQGVEDGGQQTGKERRSVAAPGCRRRTSPGAMALGAGATTATRKTSASTPWPIRASTRCTLTVPGGRDRPAPTEAKAEQWHIYDKSFWTPRPRALSRPRATASSRSAAWSSSGAASPAITFTIISTPTAISTKAPRKCTDSPSSSCPTSRVFEDVVEDLLAFVKDAELIIHNAPFDVGLINTELGRLGRRHGRVERSCNCPRYPGAGAPAPSGAEE